MTVAMVSYSDSRAQYESVGDVTTPKPRGLVLHAASELPDGRVQIIDVWEDQDSAQSFEKDVLFPAFQQAGLLEQLMAAPHPVGDQTFELVRWQVETPDLATQRDKEVHVATRGTRGQVAGPGAW